MMAFLCQRRWQHFIHSWEVALAISDGGNERMRRSSYLKLLVDGSPLQEQPCPKCNSLVLDEYNIKGESFQPQPRDKRIYVFKPQHERNDCINTIMLLDESMKNLQQM